MRRIFRHAVLRKTCDSSETPHSDDEEPKSQRQQLLSHSTHRTYDISIGRKGGDCHLRRQPSTESHFLVSRGESRTSERFERLANTDGSVALSPLVIVDKVEPYPPPAQLPLPFPAASPPFSMIFHDEKANGIASQPGQDRCISFAARAYLPTSGSFFTSSTSLDMLSNANQDKQNRPIPSWPSSVMMHSASSPIRASTPSLPIIQAHRHETQDSGEEAEDDFGALRSRGTTETVSTNRSSPCHRTSSCPALRGAFHAQRERQSMMMSMDSASVNVDEFGRQVMRDDGNSVTLRNASRATQLLSPPPRVPTPHSVSGGVRQALTLSPLLTEPSKSNRHTFGNARATEMDFCPSPSRQLTDSVVSLDRLDRRLASPSRPCSTSSHTSSTYSLIRATRRIASNDLLPSPQESVFRFPALCSAAASQNSGSGRSSPSLSSARMHAIILRANATSVQDQAAYQTPPPPRSNPITIEITPMSQTPRLGSPIRLTSEDGDQTTYTDGSASFTQSSSYCSKAHSLQGDESEDDDCVFEFPVQIPRNAHSASNLRDAGPRPQAFFQSTSMPTVKLETTDKVSSDEDVVEEDITATEVGCHTAQRMRSESDASVRAILLQQRLVMQRLRTSQRWSPTAAERTGADQPDKALTERSSWTLCVAEEDLDSSLAGEASQSSVVGCVTHFLDELVPATRSCKTVERAEKSTQTDHIPPPRPFRHRDRTAKKRAEAAWPAATPRVPGICIMLASPRRLDEDQGDFEQPHDLPGQALSEVAAGSLDARLLMPVDLRSIDDIEDEIADTSIAGILDVGLGIESVFQGELEEMLDSIAGDGEQDSHGCPKQRLTSHSYDGMTSFPPTTPRRASIPPPPSSGTSDNKALRESTTTAAIEAMLAQLRRAQGSPPNVSPLGSGGRRHEKQQQQQQQQQQLHSIGDQSP